MLNNIHSLLRLFFCVALSASVHGGLVFYDWMSNPAESRLAHAPVVVSFLPETDVASTVLSEKPKPAPDLTATVAKPRAEEVESPVAQPKPVTAPPKEIVKKVLPQKPLAPVVTEAPEAMAQPADMVCMAPQDAVSEKLAELFPESSAVLVADGKDVLQDESADRAEQKDPRAAEDSSFDSTSVAAYQALVEAVPNYRSNPLPEYPYLARQKHWEGVVWLLVDVATDGSVDDLRVEKSCGHRVLDRTARRTVSRWQFSPATRAGLAVTSQVRIPIRFRLDDD